MALETLPYSIEYHNSLPGIAGSEQQFVDLKATEFFDKIGQIVIKHQDEQTFGLALRKCCRN